MKCGQTINDLIRSIYPGLNTLDPAANQDNWFLERTILCARNDQVDDLNLQCLNKMRGNVEIFHSADKATVEEAPNGESQYPVEYLNSINGSGLPLATLKLKLGCPIMILRNLDPTAGLCNGTRAIVTHFRTRVLQVRILGGEHAGQTAFIPRITLTPSNLDLPFALERRQFPVRLAFAMSINKSQGQSVKQVGLNLQLSVFTHGQLYVALSRSTTKQGVKAIFPEGKIAFY